MRPGYQRAGPRHLILVELTIEARIRDEEMVDVADAPWPRSSDGISSAPRVLLSKAFDELREAGQVDERKRCR
jgi:hypothetical protein